MAIRATYSTGHCPHCCEPIKEGQMIEKYTAYNIRSKNFERLWCHQNCRPQPNSEVNSRPLGRLLGYEDRDGWLMPDSVNVVRICRPIFLERSKHGKKIARRDVTIYYNHETGRELVADFDYRYAIYRWTPEYNPETETGWYQAGNTRDILKEFLGPLYENCLKEDN